MSAAWMMYANDNNGQLVLNPDGPDGGKYFKKPSWAGGWLDFTSSSDNTNTALLQGTENRIGGLLGGYVSDLKIYKCPEDSSFTVVSSQKVSRTRSASLNCFLGGIQTENSNLLNTFTNSRFQIYARKSDFYSINPSTVFQFIEESPESINDGCFNVYLTPAMDQYGQLTPSGFIIVDYPAAFHENGAALSFVDGHVELWTWRDSRTTVSHKENTQGPFNTPTPDNPDVARLVLATSKSK